MFRDRGGSVALELALFQASLPELSSRSQMPGCFFPSLFIFCSVASVYLCRVILNLQNELQNSERDGFQKLTAFIYELVQKGKSMYIDTKMWSKWISPSFLFMRKRKAQQWKRRGALEKIHFWLYWISVPFCPLLPGSKGSCSILFLIWGIKAMAEVKRPGLLSWIPLQMPFNRASQGHAYKGDLDSFNI